MQQGLPESLAASLVRLRAVRQRSAEVNNFNSRVDAVESEVMQEVTRLQDELRRQQEQGRTLAQLSFRPDVKLLSLDGNTAVPALRHVLTSNSRVLERMFAAHTAEAQSGTIKTEATLSVLEHVMKSLHCAACADDEADAVVLLGACELAARWELGAVFRSTASALRNKLDARSAALVLAAADKHVEADAASAGWQKLREDAAAALARLMPMGALQPAFKTLGLSSILEVVSHVKEDTVTVPDLDIDITSPGYTGSQIDFYGPLSKDLVWRPRDRDGVKFDEHWLGAQKRDDSSLTLYMKNVGHVTGKQVEFAIKANNKEWRGDNDAGMSTLPAGQGFGWHDFLSPQEIPTAAVEGKITVRGTVTVPARQRKADVLNMWLLATESVNEPLSPAELLLCLRAHACDFNAAAADTSALKEQLSERGLDTSGGVNTLRTRLRDAMHAALPVASPPSRLRHLGSACHALAELTAVFLPKAVADGSLFELDAASFSMVLAQDKLVVASESAVLEHALRWGSRAGRTEEVVSRVMPLVRFPLVSLLRPSAALKRLQQGNAVVAQLIKEALALQVKPASAVATFVPTRHRLIEGVLPDDTDDVPRAKRRKYCKDDKVAAVDPAEAIFATAF